MGSNLPDQLNEMALHPTGDGSYTPVGAHDENIGIYGEIFAVPTAHIKTDRSGRDIFEKGFDDRPWLFFVSVFFDGFGRVPTL